MDLTLYSPAKVNLFLRILKKRSDGYHDLASLFQAVSLFDTLHFSLSDKDQLTCTDNEISCGNDNFVTRAVDLFRKRVGVTNYFKIHIQKRIPQQAGFGGGSSNCATTLYALNKLCKSNISEEILRSWAGEISADAPFFFSTGTAYCEGIGERVLSFDKLSYLQDKFLYLIKPKMGLSTAEIFRQLTLPECSILDPQELLRGFQKGVPLFQNDLESVAYRVCPSLNSLKRELLSLNFDHLFMTGSGSAHVGISSKALPSIHNREYVCVQARAVNRPSSDEWYSL